MQRICDDMLSEEVNVFKILKKYMTKYKKGVLLILKDIQILCVNDKDTMGFSIFEHIGTVILNK
jgi:hypothetical protein